MDDEVPDLSATELAERIRRGERSPSSVVDAYLDRIRKHDDGLNAYVTVLEDRAREAAVEAERAVERGDELGPLHGVPVALKDLTAFVEGVRHTFGCRLFEDHVASHTAVFVERLESAGAIVLGKTNTPEFGHRPTTDNMLVGPTANPFDPGTNAGGSSGGSAAAVAAGLTALGQGGDAGGSVRIPAALCGVYGLKPTFGRIPQAPRPDGFQYDTPFVDKGPLTRTVADAALALDVMAGPHPRDPHCAPDDGSDFLGAVDRPVDDLTVAYSPGLGAFPVAPDVERIVEEAVVALERAGATVDPVEVDLGHGLDELRTRVREPVMQLLSATVAGNLEDAHGLDFLGADRDGIPDPLASRIRWGRSLTAMDVASAQTVRTDVFDAIQDVFDAHDVLVTPTVGVTSVPNGILGPDEVDGRSVDPASDWLLTWPFNLTGHPAASVPAGLADGEHPVGMQVVAPRFGEETVLAASAAVERERPWRHHYDRIAL